MSESAKRPRHQANTNEVIAKKNKFDLKTEDNESNDDQMIDSNDEETIKQFELWNDKEAANEEAEEARANEIKNLEINEDEQKEEVDEDDEDDGDDGDEKNKKFKESKGEDSNEQQSEKKKSKNKFGIIFLSRIPPGRNYTRLRDIFSTYGEVGNIYLVPDKLANERLEKKGKPFKCYSEGFIEFKKKKVAKMVAELLNGQPIEKSKNGVKGFIWDIRYLHRVKWHHLMAKLKHAKALEEQRVRLETEKARESADHYLEMMNEWKRRERNNDFASKDNVKRIEQLINKQKPTKQEFMELKAKLQKDREDQDMNNLYSTLFS